MVLRGREVEERLSRKGKSWEPLPEEERARGVISGEKRNYGVEVGVQGPGAQELKLGSGGGRTN